MAEFVEVCKQALRMVESECDVKLTHMALKISANGAMKLSDGTTAETAEALEKTIMKWAAEHPAQKYPSWKEWQDANFPDAEHRICPMAFGAITEDECDIMGCADCTKRAIPEHIAKKLGVKAIERSKNK